MTAQWYTGLGTSTSATVSNVRFISTTGTSTATTTSFYDPYSTQVIERPVIQNKLFKGQKVELPDGSKLEIDTKGNFKLIDADAKIQYLGNRIREFNKYINASDLIEQFIKELGLAGVKQGEILNVPIELFINWLIHKAAEQDGEQVPVTIPKLPQLAFKHNHPRCKHCGRFLRKLLHSKGLQFCNGEHYQKHLSKNYGY
jgi:hypothetical protein